LTKALFLMHLRNRATLFWNMLFPLFILVIYRLVFSDTEFVPDDFMSWVLPGVLVFNLLAFGLIGSSSVMVQMREKGVLRRIQASPVPPRQLMSSYLTVNILIALMQSALIVVFSIIFFQVPITLLTAALAFPMVVAGILACVAMGGVISGLAPTAGVALAIGQILNFSQMFIADLVMPLQIMPDWIQKVAPFLPAYAVVQLVRSPLIEGVYSPSVGSNLLVVAAYTLVCTLLAIRFFRWEPKA
jgi:ABC-2 type transport system permease protein